MIILGSTSPRRKELLKLITSDFEIVAPLFDESKIEKQGKHYALDEANGKANSLKASISENDCLICCDTIVLLDNKILGKPLNKLDAIKTLQTLSNQTHQVVSAYVIVFKNKTIKKEVVTDVVFNELSLDLIQKYVNNVYVLDKAGSYSIQDDKNYHLIKEIKGSFYNVMGLPVENIEKDLKKLKII